MNFKCDECGGEKVYAKPTTRRIGIYCADCNKWICWTTYKKMMELRKEMKPEELNDNVALRKIHKHSGITKMTCSKCDCLLYNSCYSSPEGQFDLVNAKYCPHCGRELI